MIPERVRRARQLATESRATSQFEQSCDADVGSFLSVLAAAVPAGGRILEIGTGAGVGTAWLVEGVRTTPGVELVTVDVDEKLVEQVAVTDWPGWVQFEIGDALDVVPRLGQFDLIFADATAGKWYGLDISVESVRPARVPCCR